LPGDQSSPAHAASDPYCGEAHQRAVSAQTTIDFRCHAGLHCFVAPVQIGKQENLAVIGGRAFLSTADYRNTLERFRDGDLREVRGQHIFENVIFSVPEDLESLAQRLERTVRDYNTRTSETEAALQQIKIPTSATPVLEEEIARLRDELDSRSRFNESLQYFLDRISSTDPEATYLAIVMNSKELLHTERASLLTYDESKNELNLRAAIGLMEPPKSSQSVLRKASVERPG
jgi:hypothetical protein